MLQKFTINCPHCHKQISLDEALTHKLQDSLRNELEQKHQADLAKLEKDLKIKAQNELKQEMELQLKNTQEELTAEKLRNRKLLEQLTETNRLLRELKQKDEERNLQMQKKLLEVEEKIRNDATKKAQEELHLKLLEKEKQLQNALKEAEELKRKLLQGSQQNQGEVLELELEKILNNEFPNDKISPVSKGIRGADIVQEVWDRNGSKCGTILWETKNAKWNEEWVGKLKNDQRMLAAETAVIVTENLPSTIKSAAYYKGVWVTHRSFAVGLAMALRAHLIQLNQVKKTQAGKAEKKDILWNYLTSVEFKHRMDAVFESFQTMRLDLEREKQVVMKNWAKREKQLELMSQNTLGLRGDLEGLLGNALPEAKIDNDQPQLSFNGNSSNDTKTE